MPCLDGPRQFFDKEPSLFIDSPPEFREVVAHKCALQMFAGEVRENLEVTLRLV
jgi:hypothetical protein